MISRNIEILPKLKRFVAEYKSPGDTKTSQTVKEGIENPMFPITVEFARSLAIDCSLFCQSSKQIVHSVSSCMKN